MHNSLVVAVAAALVIFLLLVWMNIALVRRSKAKASRTEEESNTSSDERYQPSKTQSTTSPPTHVGLQSRAEETAKESLGSMSPDSQAAPNPLGGQGVDDNDSNAIPTGVRNKVFGKKQRPYVLVETVVPEFDTATWHEIFLRLSGDAHVMGWAVFRGDKLGAADRNYDAGFLDVVCAYYQSLKHLQHEVGLSNVLETSIFGFEGKVRFLMSDVHEHWCALFVDHDADIDAIARPLQVNLSSALV